MNNYLIKVNEEELPVKRSDVEALDIIKTSGSHYHVLQDNKAYSIELLETDFLNKKLSISVNGNSYEVEIEDEYDQKVKEMGLFTITSQKLNSIEAPMPGLIIDIMVEAGQEITEGTPLLILSAMKMENIILAEGDGVVKSVNVGKDEAVEKGQLIIEME